MASTRSTTDAARLAISNPARQSLSRLKSAMHHRSATANSAHALTRAKFMDVLSRSEPGGLRWGSDRREPGRAVTSK